MTRMNRNWLTIGAIVALLLFVLEACGGNATPAAPPPTNTAAPAATATPLPATATPEPVAELDPTGEPAVGLAPTEEPVPVEAIPEPVEAEATAEPVAEEPAEAGGDLTVEALLAAFPDAPQAQGEVLLLTGGVLDVDGQPLEGATVEIWQTDASGVYDHPGDPATASRDRTFQFYGTSIADEHGVYLFRTILPGEYEPRPRHIHVKVKIGGAEVLTTQFYFSQDRAQVEGEAVFRQAGSQGDRLLIQLLQGADAAGNPLLLAANDIVVDAGSGAGSPAPTPAQAEGPYYPLVAVSDYDNDLTIVP